MATTIICTVIARLDIIISYIRRRMWHVHGIFKVVTLFHRNHTPFPQNLCSEPRLDSNSIVLLVIHRDSTSSILCARSAASPATFLIGLGRRHGLLSNKVLGRPRRFAGRTVLVFLHLEEPLDADVVNANGTFFLRASLTL